MVQEVNHAIGIREAHGELQVLSFGEGKPHSIGQLFPQVHGSACMRLALASQSTSSAQHKLLCALTAAALTACVCGVQMQIVDESSANPGYGRFQLVQDADHVNVNKPPHRKHITCRLTLRLIKAIMHGSAPAGSEAASEADTEDPYWQA